ncbi:MAG: hypothetical protein SGJ27_09465 [Candidatus Melainabacteria bacterium]|nr:hypothetical protein [Candidatus Melainabacteria bacterium]
MLKKLRLSFVASLLAGVCLLCLNGCAAKPGRQVEKLMQDDTYDVKIVHEKTWTVQYQGLVNITIDADGIVNIYGTSATSIGAIMPNVKVSGPAKFIVHSAQNLKAEDGAIVDAHNCVLVKAGDRTTVRAYQCQTVRALNTATSVLPFGNTQIERVEGPPAPTVEAGKN